MSEGPRNAPDISSSSVYGTRSGIPPRDDQSQHRRAPGNSNTHQRRNVILPQRLSESINNININTQQDAPKDKTSKPRAPNPTLPKYPPQRYISKQPFRFGSQIEGYVRWLVGNKYLIQTDSELAAIYGVDEKVAVNTGAIVAATDKELIKDPKKVSKKGYLPICNYLCNDEKCNNALEIERAHGWQEANKIIHDFLGYYINFKALNVITFEPLKRAGNAWQGIMSFTGFLRKSEGKPWVICSPVLIYLISRQLVSTSKFTLIDLKKNLYGLDGLVTRVNKELKLANERYTVAEEYARALYDTVTSMERLQAATRNLMDSRFSKLYNNHERIDESAIYIDKLFGDPAFKVDSLSEGATITNIFNYINPMPYSEYKVMQQAKINEATQKKEKAEQKEGEELIRKSETGSD